MKDDGSVLYFDAARKISQSAVFALWGKARPAEDGIASAHPLICHMADVACVANILMAKILPRATVRRLFMGLRLPTDHASDESLRRWLSLFVALHDLGKATPAFQVKWQGAKWSLPQLGFDLAAPPNARDHGTVGVRLVASALRDLGLDATFAHRIGRAVASHHGTFPTDAEVLGRALSPSERGKNPVWAESRAMIVRILANVLGVHNLPPPQARRNDDWPFFGLLAGLTTVADWVGSMREHFVYECPPSSLEGYISRARCRAERALESVWFRQPDPIVQRSFSELFELRPNPLQTMVEEFARSVRPPTCLVLEAQMGAGKTEAALHVVHTFAALGIHDGVYLALPTQGSATQIVERLAAFLMKMRPADASNLQPLHGEAILSDRVRDLLHSVHGGEFAELTGENWFLDKKRMLLAPFGVGTVDQMLLSVFRSRHAFVRQLGLAGKTVVFDDVHAYDTCTSSLLDRLLAWLGALGSSVIILTAALPSRRRLELLEAYAGRRLETVNESRYPRLSAVNSNQLWESTLESGATSTEIQLSWLPDNGSALVECVKLQLELGGIIGVIRNTVERAQATHTSFRAARARGELPADTELLLYHSRFRDVDRRKLERTLISAIGKYGRRPERLLVVGTQILEQSLDIDFDFIVTDLAPIDIVLQRAGRLHRHPGRDRPPETRRATLGVIIPTGDPRTCNLRHIGAVYEPYVLRRSLLLLRGLSRLSIPDDIERLVESIYTTNDRTNGLPYLETERDAFERQRSKRRFLSLDRVWPDPRAPDDPFSNLSMHFDEGNPTITHSLRSETWLGEPSAEIVCLYGTGTPDDRNLEGPVYLDSAHSFPVRFDREPDAETVRTLVDHTIRVSTPRLLPGIDALPTPAVWQDVSVLARRRVLVFGDTPVRIGSFTLHLDAELGLVIRREERDEGRRTRSLPTRRRQANATFSLLTAGWIPCRTHNGARIELSIGAVLERARDLDSVHDPSPLITLALHRLLLAILHRTFGPHDLAAWKELFARGSFDMGPLGSYLEQHRDRFDLLHPERPFYQTRGLPTEYEANGLERLIFERSPYGAPSFLFEHRPTENRIHDRLSFAEAARALLAVQAFSPGGLIRKAGEPNSASAGPLNHGAYVLVRGRSLFDTLMANLLVYRPEDGEPIPGSREQDRPAWEQAPLERPVENREPKRAPYGWIDLLSWQSRRIELALTDDGSAVRGAVFCVGHGLDFTGYEPMLSYRQTRKSNVVSVDISEERELWRDCHTLVCTASPNAARSPRAVDQIRQTGLRAFYRDSSRLILDIFGMQSAQAKILQTRAERLSIPVRLVEDAERVTALYELTTLAETSGETLRDAVGSAIATHFNIDVYEVDRYALDRFAGYRDAVRAYWNVLAREFDVYLNDIEGGSDATADRAFAAKIQDSALNSWQIIAGTFGADPRQLQATIHTKCLFSSSPTFSRINIHEPLGEYRTFIESLYALAKRGDRSTLATLRNSLSNPTAGLRFVMSFLPENAPSQDESALLLVAGLFGMHPAPGSLSIAGALRKVSNEAARIERRFRTLLAGDREGLSTDLRYAVSLARNVGLALDYDDMLHALLQWDLDDRPVQCKWAHDFWGHSDLRANEEEDTAQ